MRERLRVWHVTPERAIETKGSIVVLGRRGEQPVAVKVMPNGHDERLSGQVLNAFGGNGVVRLLDQSDGALLLEQLRPGHSLASLGVNLDDEETTGILSDVILKMSPGPVPEGTPSVESWGASFGRYTLRASNLISQPLIEEAHQRYSELCASQTSTRLLHGDLHHHNVLLDSERGWLAIDPKGVVGEPAYELGAALRNPAEQPDLFRQPATIKKRVECFAKALSLDAERVLGWAFAQAVLAALWELEDDGVLNAGIGWIALANAIQPMLNRTDA
ncbi:MAG TPA: aminoglycoside phosphotransferase family protein [Vicinamibacterales bacterium]